MCLRLLDDEVPHGIYVETENDIRRERFISRACNERNQDEENAIKHWNYLIDAGEKYVKPFRDKADLILNGNANLEYFADILEYFDSHCYLWIRLLYQTTLVQHFNFSNYGKQQFKQ